MDELMTWKKIVADDSILAFWPGTMVSTSDIDGPTGIHVFFKDVFDIRIKPVGCVTTLPDVDANKNEIPGTGGRHDFFFFVNSGDVLKFAYKRFRFGMRLSLIHI